MCRTLNAPQGNDNPTTVLLAKVDMSIAGALQYMMTIKVPGPQGPKLGKVGQSSLVKAVLMNQIFGTTGGGRATGYHLEVQAGMDLLGMLCLAVAVDEMREEKAKSNKKKGRNSMGLFV